MLELPGACCSHRPTNMPTPTARTDDGCIVILEPTAGEEKHGCSLSKAISRWLLTAIVGADGRLGNSLVGTCHWEAPA